MLIKELIKFSLIFNLDFSEILCFTPWTAQSASVCLFCMQYLIFKKHLRLRSMQQIGHLKVVKFLILKPDNYLGSK